MMVFFTADGIDDAGEEKIGADDDGRDEKEEGVDSEFFVEALLEGESRDDAEKQEKVASAEEHEENDDRLYIGAPVVGDAGVFGGKSPGGDGSEGMADGIEEGHSPEVEEQGFRQGQGDIDDAEDFRRAGDSRSELVPHGFDARDFGVVEGLSADAEHGKDRKGEHHDSEAADPMGEASPEKDSVSEAFHSVREEGAVHQDEGFVDDGGAGGGKTGNGFEEGVEPLHFCDGDEGEGSEEGDHDPSEGNHSEAFAGTGPDAGLLLSDEKCADAADGGREESAGQHSEDIAKRIVHDKCDEGGERHGDSLQKDETGNQIKDDTQIHVISSGKEVRVLFRIPA